MFGGFQPQGLASEWHRPEGQDNILIPLSSSSEYAGRTTEPPSNIPGFQGPQCMLSEHISLDSFSLQPSSRANTAAPPRIPHPENPNQATHDGANRAAKRRRKVQPVGREWERHKAFLHQIYMEEDRTLEATMAVMEGKNFHASKKAYKQQFNDWGWCKKMPRSVAKKLIQKAEARAPSQSEFRWGGKMWTVDRVRNSYERGIGTPQDITTPSDLDITTPRTPWAAPQAPPTPAFVGDETWTPSNLETMVSKGHRAPEIDHSAFQWRNMSLDEIRMLFSEATAALRAGDYQEAGNKLQKALAGFSRLLPPLHDETVKTAYRLASVFARSNRMRDANSVLNWVTNSHLRKCGLQDTKTLKHYLRTAELLQSWDRKADAEVLVLRIMEAWKSPSGMEVVDVPSTGSVIPQAALQGLSDGDVLAMFPETEDTRAIDSQLQIVDLWFSASLRGLDEVLPRLISQCKRHPEKLALQGVRAECFLARLKIERQQNEEARAALDNAKASVWELLAETSPAQEILTQCRAIAFLYFDNNQKSECDSTLEGVIRKLEPRLNWRDKSYFEQVYSFILQIVWHFHNVPSPEDVAYWTERLFGLSTLTFGPMDPRTKKAERLMKAKGDGIQLIDDIDDIMKRGGASFTISIW